MDNDMAIPVVHEFRGGSSFPEPYHTLVEFFEFTALDLFQLFHLDCIQQGSYYLKLILMTVLPLSPLFLVQLHQAFLHIPQLPEKDGLVNKMGGVKTGVYEGGSSLAQGAYQKRFLGGGRNREIVIIE